MLRRAWLFGVILAVPLIGFAVAESIQAKFNSDLRSALRRDFPGADAVALSSATLDRFCESFNEQLGDLCGTNRNLNLMSAAALGAGVAGIALLLIIRLAGAASRENRTLLLYVFKPGLYLTASVLIVLILIHAAVAMGAIYYGESALWERVHVKLIGFIGIGAVAGVIIIARNAFALVKKARTVVIGNSLSRTDAPKLWGTVDDLARRLESLKPQNIVLGLEPNFFVTEADVVCLNGTVTGRTLYCSLPLCRIFSVEEFSAVIGHELAHFKGEDTKFSERFYQIYRGTASSIDSLE